MNQPLTNPPSKLEETYDTAPYQSNCHYQTHPDYLYMLGRLHHLTPPDYKTARVLELACSCGGNIGPFAQAFPDSTCLGIDLSGEQIRIANMFKEKLGLKNVDFQKRDILDLSVKKDGKFDYIMCHGTLSWVPPHVQEHIYKICGEMLTENGMAVISYNAKPGWNTVQSIRDMMLYETRHCTDLKTKADKAVKLLSFLTRNISEEQKSGYSSFLKFETDLLSKTFEAFVLYDHIAEYNDTFYLHEFVSRIEAHGLGYVCDTDMMMYFPGYLKGELHAFIAGIGNRLERQQMIDFIHNQRFHTSIITKSQKPVTDNLRKETVFDFYLLPVAKPKEENPDTSQSVTFCYPDNEKQTLTVKNQKVSELLIELYYHGPTPIKADELIEKTAQSLGENDLQTYKNAFLDEGVNLISAGFLQIFSQQSKTVLSLSEKPKAYDYTRLQATLLPKMNMLVNAQRGAVNTKPYVNYALQYCDGTHTQDQIADKLMEHYKAGNFAIVDQHGLPITDTVQIRARINSMTFSALDKLANANVFVE